MKQMYTSTSGTDQKFQNKHDTLSTHILPVANFSGEYATRKKSVLGVHPSNRGENDGLGLGTKDAAIWGT